MRFDIDYSHAKTMATRLQSFLEGSPKKLSRSSAIEAVAQILGFNNRNEMAARIDAEATIDQSAQTIAMYQQVIEEVRTWRNNTPMTGEECYSTICMRLNDLAQDVTAHPQQAAPITARNSSDIFLDEYVKGPGLRLQSIAMQAIEETKDWPIGRSFHDSLQRRVKELSDGYETANSVLEYDRRMAAEEEVQNYEFDLPFKARSGWKFTTGEDQWSCPIFIEDPENPDGPSVRGDFVVIFEPNSAKVITAYGTVGGNDIGYRHDASAAEPQSSPMEIERNSMPDNFIHNDRKSKRVRKEEIEKTAALILEHALEHAHGKTFQDAMHTEVYNSGISVLHCVEQKLTSRFMINIFATAELATAFDGLEMEGAKIEGFTTPEERLARALVNHSLDRAEQLWVEPHS